MLIILWFVCQPTNRIVNVDQIEICLHQNNDNLKNSSRQSPTNGIVNEDQIVGESPRSCPLLQFQIFFGWEIDLVTKTSKVCTVAMLPSTCHRKGSIFNKEAKQRRPSWPSLEKNIVTSQYQNLFLSWHPLIKCVKGGNWYSLIDWEQSWNAFSSFLSHSQTGSAGAVFKKVFFSVGKQLCEEYLVFQNQVWMKMRK